MKESKTIFLFFIPTIIFMAIFSYYPVLLEIYYSFFEWDGVNAKYIGINNFVKMLSDENFGVSVKNLIVLLVIQCLLSIVFPLIGAYLVYLVRNERVRYFYRVFFIIPMVVNAVVMILLWQFIYDYDVGLLNQILRSFGLSNLTRNWLGDKNTALLAISLIGFPWITSFNYGLYFLVYSAGLDNIPTSINDSAQIEGCSGWKKFSAIDFPLVRSQTKIVLILTIINTLQYLTPILVMTQGGPGNSTMVPALVMFFNGFQFNNMGYASAIGLTLFVAIFILSWLNNKYIKGAEL